MTGARDAAFAADSPLTVDPLYALAQANGSADSIPRLLAELRAFGVQLGIFVIAFVLAYAAGRLLAVPLVERALRSQRVTPTVRRPAMRFTRAVAVFVAFFAGLFFARLTALLTVTGGLAAALTLGVGFASRDILSNLVGGLFIITDPKFNIGDWIEWGPNEGIIEDISFRVTRVRTFQNELITVPNSALASTVVVNHAIKDRLRIDQPVSVAGDADVEAVRRILLAATADDPTILDEPRPTVDIDDLSASGVTLVARYWIADPDRATYIDVRSRYAQAVKERFAREAVDLSPEFLELGGELTVREEDASRE